MESATLARLAKGINMDKVYHVKPQPQFDLMPVSTGDEPCRTKPELFGKDDWDVTDEDREAVSNICQTCPILTDCFRYALASKELGLWAGTTSVERYLLLHSSVCE